GRPPSCGASAEPTDSRRRLMTDTEVLIAGAGPTGLFLAVQLARNGVRFRLVDKAAEPGTTSRALAVQCRTLELYRQAGFADALLERGVKFGGVNLWVGGRKRARLPFEEIGRGFSPYPSGVIFPQDEHERFLIEQLADLGVSVERPVELTRFEQLEDRIFAH